MQSVTTDHQYRTRLEQVMKEEGRMQRWLARRTGIHETRISNYVTGRLTPGPTNRRKIAAVLKLDEADLFHHGGVR